jgi:hypothetical protein
MLILLPAGLLIATFIFMAIMRRRDVGRGLIWSAGAVGSITAIIVSLFLLRQIPLEIVIQGSATSVYSRLPITLLLDGTAWAYQTALLAILSAVLLTATRRQATSTPNAWIASIGITTLGLVAIQAGSLFTLLSAWFLIDTLELIYLLAILKPQHDLGKLVTSFVLRYIGILVAFISIGAGSDKTGFLILLAAMLRLGVLPFWSYWGDFSTLIGLGTIMQAVKVLSALTPLARLEAGAVPDRWSGLLILYCLLLMLYCAIRWLHLDSAGEGRAYWITAVSLIAFTCVIHNQAAASVPWVVTALLAGSALFLFTDRTRFYLILALANLVGLTGLPYTPVSSGWSGLLGSPVDWRSIPFILANVLFLVGGLRLAVKTPEPERRIEGLARFAYPAGLGLLLVMPWVIMLFSVNETPLLDWWAGFITFALLLVIILLFRDQIFEGVEFKWPATRFWLYFVKVYEGGLTAIQQDWLITIFNRFTISIGRLTHSMTQVLEGEGGVLWVFLLLALFASLLVSGGSP